MYREKLDTLFQKAKGLSDDIIENLKQLVRYQNFCIEEQILLQARSNGINIPSGTIEQKDKQRILEHDKAINAIVSINTIAHKNGCQKIFDFEPHPVSGQISKFEQNDHTVAAYIVADFINEYYNLGLEMSRYDRAFDDTTFNKVNRIQEKEWFGATEALLPKEEYNEARLDLAPETVKTDVTRIEEQINDLKDIMKSKSEVDITLFNGVEMDIKKNNDYSVTLTSRKDFTDTSGILRPETSAGFEADGPKKMSAKDLLMAQIEEIIKDNGGINNASIQKHKSRDDLEH